MSWKAIPYEDADGAWPFVAWFRDLSPVKRAAVQAAVVHVLEPYGPEVTGMGWGRHIGGGIFEFYVEQTEEEVSHRFASGEPPVSGPSEEVWLRLFCHAYGSRRILVVTGFDKGRLGDKRQNAVIEDARTMLAEWKRRQQ